METRSNNEILKEMRVSPSMLEHYTEYEAAKYKGRWAVFCRTSCTFEYIGAGRKFCEKKARHLNEMMTIEEKKSSIALQYRFAAED